MCRPKWQLCDNPDCICDKIHQRKDSGDQMTNQQKYKELLEKYQELGFDVDRISKKRTELSLQMGTIARGFPDQFYFKVEDKLLYRANSSIAIAIRKFDK